MDVDDLRSGLEEFDEEELDDEGLPFPIDFGDGEPERPPNAKGFLGMTPIERMLLSVMFFLNVLVFGAAILFVTGRIG